MEWKSWNEGLDGKQGMRIVIDSTRKRIEDIIE